MHRTCCDRDRGEPGGLDRSQHGAHSLRRYARIGLHRDAGMRRVFGQGFESGLKLFWLDRLAANEELRGGDRHRDRGEAGPSDWGHRRRLRCLGRWRSHLHGWVLLGSRRIQGRLRATHDARHRGCKREAREHYERVPRWVRTRSWVPAYPALTSSRRWTNWRNRGEPKSSGIGCGTDSFNSCVSVWLQLARAPSLTTGARPRRAAKRMGPRQSPAAPRPVHRSLGRPAVHPAAATLIRAVLLQGTIRGTTLRVPASCPTPRRAGKRSS